MTTGEDGPPAAQAEWVPPQSLLALLERAANQALGTVRPDKRVRLEQVRLRADEIVLVLGVRAPIAALEGRYQVRLRIVESTPERTVCEPQWRGGLGRLVGMGARLAPRGLLNEALQSALGGWVRVDGAQVMIDHAGLLQRLTGRG